MNANESSAVLPPDRSGLLTEQRNPRTAHLHTLSAAECVAVIQQEDRAVFAALEAARGELTAFIAAAEARFCAGGRLIYVGAGTSGRLGVLDASEAPPTFQVPPGRIVGLIAGGDGALRKSSEGKEDDFNGANEALATLNLTPQDSLLGLAAGGTTPYALGALVEAKRVQPQMLTGFLSCTPVAKPAAADHLIVLATGPEVLTGSTRMKAGTATKLALNTISTTLMIRAGRVHENLMVDMRGTNEKLRDRAARIIATLTGLDRAASFKLLDQADGEVKTAVLMQQRKIGRTEAQALLARHGQKLGDALEKA